ncbi:MAG: DUF2339 domain-containing protein [Rhizobiales bacterium]|nr:DUF2339 domain-containing protein [Hyphomicrobiales bacterium]
MESFFALGLLLFLAGPILAIIALVQIGNLNTKLRAMKKELERLTPGTVMAPAAAAPGLSTGQKTQMAVTAEPEQRLVAPGAPGETAKPAASTNWSATPSAESATPAPGREASPPPASRDVEKALASRWFVWVGGVAIALGGLLFVKYAHDQGLIPPVLRVIIGLAAAVALIFAGEWVRKRGDELARGYVPAALSAAGLVIAFGVIYAAYALYDLLSPGICFPLLVAVALAALWLSRRQGPFIAALGLVGAYVAPALVPSEHPSAAGFFAFLLVIVLASLYELRSRPWWWLGFAAIAGATLWSLLWTQGAFFDASHVVPAGVFALVMGAGAVLLPVGRGILAEHMGTLAKPDKLMPPMQIAIAGCAAASLVLAALVWQTHYATLALLFFAVAMLAITAFGWLRGGMVAAPLAAGLATLVLLMAWPEVGFYEWAMDERGFWSTVPGLIEPPRFRTAVFVALAAFTAIGLAGVFRRAERLPWAALASGAAVFFLFGAWSKADFVQSNISWAVIGLVLAALLAAATDRIWQVAGRAADVTAAGTVLLALFAIDRLADGVWQTLLTAALAGALAFATRRVQSVNLAGMAAATGSLAALRLFIGREFWGEPGGLPLGAHWVLYGYGVPVLLFWLAARDLRRDGYARWRAAFEGLALGLGIALVSLELRVLIAGGITADHMGLLEMSAHALAWLGAAYGLAYRQTMFSSFISLWGARLLLAASCAVLFIGLTGRNPVITGDALEGSMIFNSLWLAYLAPVPLLALMARKLEGLGLGKARNALGVFALVLLIAFVTLQVKRFFQDETLVPWFESDAESYSVSAAWIATAIAIFLAGIRLSRQNIRLAGLAIIALAVAKVFALDLFELGGLWRIASIIGLGLCLIGVGWVYTRFVQAPRTGATA